MVGYSVEEFARSSPSVDTAFHRAETDTDFSILLGNLHHISVSHFVSRF